MIAKTATEPNSYLGNLRSGGFHQLGPIGLTMDASVSPRPLLVILAEHTGLIAKKSPPRMCWPSACYGHVARHGGLGDAETEHEKLTMDPWRAPRESSHGTSGQSDCGPHWKPLGRPPRQRPRDRYLEIADQPSHQACTPFRPPTRQQYPKQTIKATEARATSSAALQYRNLMAQRDRFQQ
jgi:hypothetical protein